MLIARFLQRYAHLLVAFLLTALLIKALTYSVSLLRVEVHRQPQSHLQPAREQPVQMERRQHVQEIVSLYRNGLNWSHTDEERLSH